MHIMQRRVTEYAELEGMLAAAVEVGTRIGCVVRLSH